MSDEQKKDLCCGIVSIVGRPNVGKSTLLNYIIGEKVTIVSNIPQTTRNQIRGIYNDERGQIIFIDTPGLHLGRDSFDKYMNRSSLGSIDGADVIVHLVDSRENTGEEEQNVVSQLNKVNVPIIVGLNKIDLKGKHVPEYISLWEEVRERPITEMADKLIFLPLSSKEGTNVDKLIDMLFEKLPKGPALYPVDTISDTPQRMVIADIVREKFFELMSQEVPHSMAVRIEGVEPRRKKVLYIRVQVLVERDSQKEIVIGKRGHVLKEVGILARRELEELLNRKVFLDIHVKVNKNWREDVSFLQDMGFSE